MPMVKNSLIAFMRRVMLTCEEATYLSTKKIVEKINLRQTMSLRMHLAACKHCRKYYLQTKIIANNIRHFTSHGLNGLPLHRMSDAEKSKLERLLSNKIKSN